ncbi:LOW QUALITY PROTEIN: hypothetical protein HID58_058906, partial [Brassica napus]
KSCKKMHSATFILLQHQASSLSPVTYSGLQRGSWSPPAFLQHSLIHNINKVDDGTRKSPKFLSTDPKANQVSFHTYTFCSRIQQGKSCQQCYKENGPIFDNVKSSTYKDDPCNSRNRNALSTTGRGCDVSEDVCKHRYSPIFIGSASGSSVSFPGTVFSCGYNNGSNFDWTSSGVIGLGGGQLSLISQLGLSILNKFSYCLSHKSSTTHSASNSGTNSIHSGIIKWSQSDIDPFVKQRDSDLLLPDARSYLHRQNKDSVHEQHVLTI